MMHPNQKPWESYRKIAAQTASPGHLVLMLYDGAIKFLEKALTGFDYKDPQMFNQTINNNIVRAQAIIHEMNGNLNMQAGGDVAQNFRRLYSYLHRCLREANMTKRREPIEEALTRLRILRDSWNEMLKRGPERNNDPAALAAA